MATMTFTYRDKKGREKRIRVGSSSTNLDFSSKNIVHIDLSPLLQFTRLRKLKLYSNELQTLDLTPLGTCHTLRELVLHRNHLQEIDLSPLMKCPGLVRLDLSSNRLTQLNLAPLANHIALSKIVLTKNPLPEIDVTPLFSCSVLRDLEVSSRTRLKAERRYAGHRRGALGRLKKRITWIEKSEAPVAATPQFTAPVVNGGVRVRVLGVLRSVPRINMANLTKYSEISEEDTRELVFDLVGAGEVSGRFNPSTDEFVSADAAEVSSKLRSKGTHVARCQHCGTPLQKLLASGEEFLCPSCGTLNIG